MKVPFPVRALPSVAEKAWRTPPRTRSLSLDQVFDDPAFEPITVEWAGSELRGFEVGDGPLVVLVHGWGGQAAQMAPLASALRDMGFKAISLDLPGHGVDDRPTSDAFQMASAVRALVDEFGEPSAVVAHSLGGIVTQIAFEDCLPSYTVLVSPVLDVGMAMSLFSEMVGLMPWTARGLRSRFADFVGPKWWSRITSGSDLEFPGTNLMVVHDVGDRQTPFDTSAALAAKHGGATFAVTSGLGHSRILADPSVSSDIAGFLGAVTRPELAEKSA